MCLSQPASMKLPFTCKDMNAEVDPYDQALAAYEKALEVYRSNGNRSEEATVLTKIGDLYRAKGEDIQRVIIDPPPPPPPPAVFNQAIEAYEEALKIYQDSNDQLKAADAWVKIGDTYLSASRKAT
ncbi:MAG: hypothetical protein Kow00121_10520 [Elainellaceae cyanobacterium]